MPVTEILEKLRSEESRLREQTLVLQKQLKVNDGELKRVRSAIVALGEKPTTKTRKSTKPTINKRDVIETIKECLQQESPIEADELKSRVQERLSTAGKAMQGFALRFREAVALDRFTCTENGYQLADE